MDVCKFSIGRGQPDGPAHIASNKACRSGRFDDQTGPSPSARRLARLCRVDHHLAIGPWQAVPEVRQVVAV
jgi:hypothetical protein